MLSCLRLAWLLAAGARTLGDQPPRISKNRLNRRMAWFCAGVPGSGGLSGSGRRVRDVVSDRAMVSENDQELT